jgi:hypothetical protein
VDSDALPTLNRTAMQDAPNGIRMHIHIGRNSVNVARRVILNVTHNGIDSLYPSSSGSQGYERECRGGCDWGRQAGRYQGPATPGHDRMNLSQVLEIVSEERGLLF